MAQRLTTVRAQIAHYEAKLAELRSRLGIQDELLRWCKKHGVTRTDLGAVYNDLPPLYITRKMRENQMKDQDTGLHKVAAVAHYQKNKDEINAGKKRQPISRRTALPRSEFMPLARKIDALIKAAGKTSVQIAAEMGVHDSLISTYRRGVYRPTPAKLALLEKILGTKLGDDNT